MRRLWPNLSILTISLALAFLLWAVATESENPTVERALNTPTPLEIQGLPETMIAYNRSDTNVRVTLRAPRSIWNNLTNNDIRAYIDLSQAVTGTNTLPVKIEMRVSPTRIVAVTPAEVRVDVEPWAEKEVAVNVRVQGIPTSGYRTDAPIVTPRVVRVRGPASRVAQVAEVRFTMDVQGEQSDVVGEYQPLPMDAAGNLVANVDVLPQTVTASVPIWQLSHIRDLAVTVALEGQPATGYRIVNLEVDPPVVKVFGRTEVVRAAPGFLQTQPISLAGRTESLTTTVALQMPEGLSTFPPARPEVTVSLSIEAIRSGMTLNVQPRIQGLGSGLSATVGIDSVVVVLSGPLWIMESLDPEMVRLTLNLTNLASGDYTIAPTVNVPREVSIVNIIPEAVPVQIKAASPTAASPPPIIEH